MDTLTHDIRYAFRTFRRAPLAALTIVATIALGLGLITVVFTFYNTFFLRPDAVRNPGELFAVERPAGSDADATLSFTRADYDAMRRETSVFTDAFAMLRSGTRVEGRRVTVDAVSGNFFRVLGVQAALGRPLTPEDDERSAGPVIVLSHRGWNKLFASDPAVIGRRLLVNAVPHDIVGVMPVSFRGLGLSPPDYWAPLALAGPFRDASAEGVAAIAIDIVGRLKPGMSPAAATAALTVWASRQPGPKNVPGRSASIRLRPRQGTLEAGLVEKIVVLSPIAFAFGLILMIGCANVANLLLARGVWRQREIGIRLSIGASRRRIVRQLLTESLLLALAAAAGGLALSRLFMQGALYAAIRTVPPDLVAVDLAGVALPSADWRVLVFLVVGAIVSTAFFGLAPALHATRLELVRTMRGEITSDAHPGRVRLALIAVQVGASALLLISAAIFLRGALAAAAADPGVRTMDTVVFDIHDESRRATLLQAVRAHPSVALVAASSQPARAVADELVSASVPVDYMTVSPEYFGVLGIDVVRGRRFTQAERTADAGVVVVSETGARLLWPNRDAVGQVVRLQAPQSDSTRAPSLPTRTLTVIGVVRDIGGGLQFPDLFAFRGVYLPTSPESAGTSLTLRVRGDLEQARQALLERLTRVDPALGPINTMKSIAGMQMYVTRLVFRVAVVLGGLALALTLSGLFGVLSYVVEQRAKEIGVRMALGATTGNVAALVLSQSLRPVGIGLVAGGGLAAVLAGALMATPAASGIGGIVRVFDPVAYAGSVLVIVTACLLATSVPILRAARIDPIATLRKD